MNETRIDVRNYRYARVVVTLVYRIPELPRPQRPVHSQSTRSSLIQTFVDSRHFAVVGDWCAKIDVVNAFG